MFPKSEGGLIVPRPAVPGARSGRTARRMTDPGEKDASAGGRGLALPLQAARAAPAIRAGRIPKRSPGEGDIASEAPDPGGRAQGSIGVKSRRGRRATEGGSAGRDFSRASHTSGNSIMTFRAEVKALSEQMPSHPFPSSLRDQEAQSGREMAEVGRTERVNPSTPPKSVPSNLELSKIARTIRDSTS